MQNSRYSSCSYHLYWRKDIKHTMISAFTKFGNIGIIFRDNNQIWCVLSFFRFTLWRFTKGRPLQRDTSVLSVGKSSTNRYICATICCVTKRCHTAGTHSLVQVHHQHHQQLASHPRAMIQGVMKVLVGVQEEEADTVRHQEIVREPHSAEDLFSSQKIG